MKIVLAPDSFKGSLDADEVCAALAEGVRRAAPQAQIVSVPMADGGEGTVDALVSATGGKRLDAPVHGPLGEDRQAHYGILGDGVTAVIEMASASGLPLVPEEKRDPRVTTTYGLGELILAALAQDCRRFVIGIGGSATNDCGTGMAQALGVQFFDAQGEELKGFMSGGKMTHVAQVETAGLSRELAECEFVVACDVENPLLGPTGATAVYGPQKGADPAMVEQLENGMEHLIGIVEKATERDVQTTPGAGAAGGLGAALMAFLGARLERGVDIVVRECHLAEKMTGADLVLTGEGRIDGQTVYGKTISGVAAAAPREATVVALGGSLGVGAKQVHEIGVDAIFPITAGPMPLAEAMQRGAELLTDAAEEVVRLFLNRRILNPL